MFFKACCYTLAGKRPRLIPSCLFFGRRRTTEFRFRFHYALTTFQVTNLLGLARSLCTSLGFNENKTVMEPQDYGSEKLDQMRAFAGAYYLSS